MVVDRCEKFIQCFGQASGFTELCIFKLLLLYITMSKLQPGIDFSLVGSDETAHAVAGRSTDH